MTALNPIIRDMLGDQLADAVDAARELCEDDTINASCNAGVWRVERGGEAVECDGTYEGAAAALGALAP
jgi:hypothetical protein